jgi:outer membrane protein assembly factor BamB
MQTGAAIWSNKVCQSIGDNNGFVDAHEGVVMAATHADAHGRNWQVSCFNATDGDLLWGYTPDVNVWNFGASFLGDGTILYQDQAGKAYRHRLSDGGLLWKAGGFPGSMTDATATLGPNGIFYTTHTFDFPRNRSATSPGVLSAYRVSDGKLLWNQTTPRPPNNAPAIAPLAPGAAFSVVQPVGNQLVPICADCATDLIAYDAETGALQWVFNGPLPKGPLQAGDQHGYQTRKALGIRAVCYPNPWSSPVVDAKGTIYVGNEDGHFFALTSAASAATSLEQETSARTFQGHVSSYDTRAAFAGSATPSLAPGMVAVASCDSLFVFRKKASVA